MSIKVPSDLQNAIEAIKQYQQILEANPNNWLSDKDHKDFMRLRKYVSEAVLPLLNDLIDARLISGVVSDTDALKKKFRSIGFWAAGAGLNGGIQIDLDEAHTWVPAVREGGHPNLPRDASLNEYSREYYRLFRGQKGRYIDFVKERKVEIESKYAEFQKLWDK